MTNAEIEELARKLWDACTTVKQAWDQLGDVTKSVWRDRVMAGQRAETVYTKAGRSTAAAPAAAEEVVAEIETSPVTRHKVAKAASEELQGSLF